MSEPLRDPPKILRLKDVVGRNRAKTKATLIGTKPAKR